MQKINMISFCRDNYLYLSNQCFANMSVIKTIHSFLSDLHIFPGFILFRNPEQLNNVIHLAFNHENDRIVTLMRVMTGGRRGSKITSESQKQTDR